MADWFYAMGSEPIGPYTAEQMKDLIRRGVINPDTLVWREGQSGWLPVREAVGKPGAGAAAEAAAQSPEAPAAAAPSPQQQAFAPAPAVPAAPSGPAPKPPKKCDYCKKKTPPGDLSPEGEFWICAPCRMEAFRRQHGGMMRFQVAQFYAAGFWIRFLARIIDGLIVGFFQGVIFVLIGVKSPLSSLPSRADPAAAQAAMMALSGSVYAISIGTALCYEVLFLGLLGATPGKLALGLKVITDEGEPIGILRAFFRYWALGLGYCTCYIGFIMAAFSENKRALHDMICGTRVVHR
jgi:uncharacterized RDD family membrane protein YckC